MHTAPLWISEADVASWLTLPEAIDALERGLMAEARGEAQNMVKTHTAWGDGHTLHALGAVFPAQNSCAPTWRHSTNAST